jgi:hypothetical protein
MCSLFLEELRLRSDKEMARIDAVEGKATSIITVAGTITSLVFGFVAFATSTLGYTFPPLIQWWIVASVIASIASILISIQALTLKKYSYLVKIEQFFKKDSNGEILKNNKGDPVSDKNTISDFLAATEEEHQKALAKQYVNAIYINSKLSSGKAVYVVWAFGFLVAGIALIGVGVILTLILPTSSGTSDTSVTYLCKLVEEGGREMTCRILQ